jgi:hypothetical protein
MNFLLDGFPELKYYVYSPFYGEVMEYVAYRVKKGKIATPGRYDPIVWNNEEQFFDTRGRTPAEAIDKFIKTEMKKIEEAEERIEMARKASYKGELK